MRLLKPLPDRSSTIRLFPATSYRPRADCFDFAAHRIASENRRISNGSADVIERFSRLCSGRAIIWLQPQCRSRPRFFNHLPLELPQAIGSANSGGIGGNRPSLNSIFVDFFAGRRRGLYLAGPDFASSSRSRAKGAKALGCTRSLDRRHLPHPRFAAGVSRLRCRHWLCCGLLPLLPAAKCSISTSLSDGAPPLGRDPGA